MIRNVIETIGGIGLYGLLSMLLFLLVFVGALAWTLRLRRPYLDHMKDLPLQDSEMKPGPGDSSHA